MMMPKEIADPEARYSAEKFTRIPEEMCNIKSDPYCYDDGGPN
jgi:hypothetical protein